MEGRGSLHVHLTFGDLIANKVTACNESPLHQNENEQEFYSAITY